MGGDSPVADGTPNPPPVAPAPSPVQSQVGLLAGVGSFALVYFGLGNLSRETRIAVYFGLMAGGAVGLLPLILACRRGKAATGLVAMFACLLCGAIGGLILAVPTALMFALISLRKTAASGTPPRA